MKAFFEKILNFFGLQWKTKGKSAQIAMVNNLSEFELIKINNSRLEALEKKMIMLAVGLERINRELQTQREEIVKDREFLVNIATLHEELLYHLDQGKVVMLRQRQEFQEEDNSSSSSADDTTTDSAFIKKHKFEIN